jgi:hypothetical protein
MLRIVLQTSARRNNPKHKHVIKLVEGFSQQIPAMSYIIVDNKIKLFIDQIIGNKQHLLTYIWKKVSLSEAPR